MVEKRGRAPSPAGGNGASQHSALAESPRSRKRFRIQAQHQPAAEPKVKRRLTFSANGPTVAEFFVADPVRGCLNIIHCGEQASKATASTATPASTDSSPLSGCDSFNNADGSSLPSTASTRFRSRAETRPSSPPLSQVGACEEDSKHNDCASQSNSTASTMDIDTELAESDSTTATATATTTETTTASSLGVNRSRHMWLTRDDLARFRSCARRLCRSVSIDHILSDAYADACSTISIEQVQTVPFVTNCDYMDQRGLERWSSSLHALERSFKIVQVKSAVLLEQASQFLTGKRDAHKLAKVAQEASITSLRFAQVLAAGDAELAKRLQLEQCGVASNDEDYEHGIVNPHSIFGLCPTDDDTSSSSSSSDFADDDIDEAAAASDNGTKPWVDYALQMFNASFPAVA